MGAIPTKTELIDIIWRSGWTYAAAFFGSFFDAVIQYGVDDLTLVLLGTILRTAAFSALFTLAKAYISNKNGTGTASERSTPVIGPQPVASNNAVPAGTTQEIVPAGVVPPREPVITQDPPPVPPPAA